MCKMSSSLKPCYRPQRSWGKVMFSQACVILFTGGVCLSACWDTTPPGADPHQEQTPPGSRHTPTAEHAGRYGQCAGSTHPTGMQSCLVVASCLFKRGWFRLVHFGIPSLPGPVDWLAFDCMYGAFISKGFSSSLTVTFTCSIHSTLIFLYRFWTPRLAPRPRHPPRTHPRT